MDTVVQSLENFSVTTMPLNVEILAVILESSSLKNLQKTFWQKEQLRIENSDLLKRRTLTD